MNKLASFILLATAITFSGCRKIIDKLFPRNDDHQHTQNCRIKKTFSSVGDNVFYYNSHGNPDSIVSTPGSTENYIYTFTYDDQQELIEYNRYYDQYPGDRVLKTNSVYTRPTDSTVFEYLKDYTTTYEETGHTYKFDSLGRIRHETRYLIFSGPGDPFFVEDIDYVYNAQGNRIAPSELEDTFNYDNKKCIYSTNRIFQFISKNYSKNNPQPASAYNAAGLPLKFVEPYSAFFGLHTNYSRILMDEVEYECEKESPGNKR